MELKSERRSDGRRGKESDGVARRGRRGETSYVPVFRDALTKEGAHTRSPVHVQQQRPLKESAVRGGRGPDARADAANSKRGESLRAIVCRPRC